MQIFPTPPNFLTLFKSPEGKPPSCIPGKQPLCLLLPVFPSPPPRTARAGLGAVRVVSLALKDHLQVKSLRRRFRINGCKPRQPPKLKAKLYFTCFRPYPLVLHLKNPSLNSSPGASEIPHEARCSLSPKVWGDVYEGDNTERKITGKRPYRNLLA